MQTEAKPRRDRDGENAERAWGVLVLAWFLAVFAAIIGWIASALRHAFKDD